MHKIGGIVLLLSVFILAQIPTYSTSTLIESDGTPIAVNEGFASPCVTDWNGDGKKDLIVGQYGDGKMRYYENVGVNENPVFKGFEYLQVNGADITLPYG